MVCTGHNLNFLKSDGFMENYLKRLGLLATSRLIKFAMIPILIAM